LQILIFIFEKKLQNVRIKYIPFSFLHKIQEKNIILTLTGREQ